MTTKEMIRLPDKEYVREEEEFVESVTNRANRDKARKGERGE